MNPTASTDTKQQRPINNRPALERAKAIELINLAGGYTFTQVEVDGTWADAILFTKPLIHFEAFCANHGIDLLKVEYQMWKPRPVLVQGTRCATLIESGPRRAQGKAYIVINQ